MPQIALDLNSISQSVESKFSCSGCGALLDPLVGGGLAFVFSDAFWKVLQVIKRANLNARFRAGVCNTCF